MDSRMDDRQRKDKVLGRSVFGHDNLPRCEFENDREHMLHFWEVSEAQLHILMDPTMVGDECIDVDLKKLAYDNKVIFHILCNTLTPTNRLNSIKSITGNALLAMSQGI